MSDIACQPTFAFVAETKLLVYNDNCYDDHMIIYDDNEGQTNEAMRILRTPDIKTPP